ncbi:hypothetical protein [Actinoplanes sp. NPDC049599]|uniref:hypothetical protein n=1 Tax=Actinoplanes sp. NPDC049599 TaxID=3363903 RepID=UPI0037BDB8D9
MDSAPVSRLASARILPPAQMDMLQTPSDAVRHTLLNEGGYLARTRTWMFGGVRPDVDHVFARLGYQTKKNENVYDPAAKDFREEAVRKGRAVNLVVRLTDLVVVYERQSAAMSDHEFIRGLRHMLRSVNSTQQWNVEQLDSKASFEEWAQHIDVVHRFRFRAVGTKIPSGKESPILAALIHPRSERLTIDWRATEGVDINDRTVRELARIATGGVGEVFAAGRKNGRGAVGEQKAWVSSGSAERVVREVPADPATGVVGDRVLLEMLATVPVDIPW